MSTEALQGITGEMNDLERARLAGVMERRAFAVGETLVSDGQPLDALWIVGSGKIELSLGKLDLGALGMGESFGELAVLEPSRASFDARALEPTTMLVLDHAALSTLRSKDEKVASLLLRGLIERLSTRVRSCNTQVVEGEAHGRLALARDPEARSWVARTLGWLFGTSRSEAA